MDNSSMSLSRSISLLILATTAWKTYSFAPPIQSLSPSLRRHLGNENHAKTQSPISFVGRNLLRNLLPSSSALFSISTEPRCSILTPQIPDNLYSILGDVDESSLPLLHIGDRVGSGSYGTVHECFLVLSNDDPIGQLNQLNNLDNIHTATDTVPRSSKFQILPCIAKRSWTLPELQNDVPAKIVQMEQNQKQQLQQLRLEEERAIAQRTGLSYKKNTLNGDWDQGEDDLEGGEGGGNEEKRMSPSELKTRAERCRHYWEVERHCFEKMEGIKRDLQTEEMETFQSRSMSNCAPSFLGVYKDDGQHSNDEIVPGYGLLEMEQDRSNGRWFGGNTKQDPNNIDRKSMSGEGHEWMVFEYVGSNVDFDVGEGDVGKSALTLLDAMEMDWKDQHMKNKGSYSHHLYDIQRAMGLPDSYDFGDVLDAIFRSLIEDISFVHSCNIVHRDLKPGNLLCDGKNQKLRIIDFGSAADLDPSSKDTGGSSGNPLGSVFSGGSRRIGLDEGIVALSPVYAAPETFVKLNENPLSFDVFSAALIMCQLMFNLLDERTDAGFHQQMKDVDYNLDVWLERELGAKLRPRGFDDALEYLGERRGLWRLLKKMFERDPLKRITSADALKDINEVIGLRNGEIAWTDQIIIKVAREESYFETVVDSFERCTVDLGMESDGSLAPRPLHFLATFKSGVPAGLILAEANEDDEKDDEMSNEDWEQWRQATKNSIPGEVFIKGWIKGGQADEIGIFEVGDRLRGVGELPFVDGGFEQALNLIERPPSSGNFKLHFDRISTAVKATNSEEATGLRCFKVSGQGAWKTMGRRHTQEDSFVLHEIYNKEVGNVLLAGVFDGHGGTAASESASRVLPSLFYEELGSSAVVGRSIIRNALEKSWEITCDNYRSGCDGNVECVADYDPTEGVLLAETGSADLVAGTTATVAAISMSPQGTNEMTILNCGDSRTLLVGKYNKPRSGRRYGNSSVAFETRDHSPDDEIEIDRLKNGRASGLDYSIPQCSMSQSWMQVGDYQYAVCRSLEGSFVTSFGIVSDPDITTLSLPNALEGRSSCALVQASDGLFEVMSNEEVGNEIVRMREEGYKAGEIAKNLCGQALKKGSYDNISVVVTFLDNL